MKVSARPPSAVPRRVSSASPRVMSAARAFDPNPSPSEMPAAMAITFLIAPPSCTPATSVLVYTRIRSLRSQPAMRSATAGVVEATVSAVGRCSATSRANVGPETTPDARNPGSSSATTSDNSLPLPGSRPLVAQASTVSAVTCGLSARRVARKAWLGTATRNCRCGAASCGRSAVTVRFSGKRMPGRKAAFSRARTRRAQCAASCPQSCTGWPLRASRMPSAVPQEPAPSTAIPGLVFAVIL